MGIDECFLLGHITKTHGTQGELVVLLDSDSPNNYKKLELVFVEINKQLIPFFVKTIKIQGNNAFVTFEDLKTVEEADALVYSRLFLPLSFLPKLSGNKFYFHEIRGYTVVDKHQGTLGTIIETMEFPQQILIQMEYKSKEVLFPFNDHTFVKIDKEQKLFYVDLPEGLVEIYIS